MPSAPVEVDINVRNKGSARATVGDRCGYDVPNTSRQLYVRREDTSIRWSLHINEHDKISPK